MSDSQSDRADQSSAKLAVVGSRAVAHPRVPDRFLSLAGVSAWPVEISRVVDLGPRFRRISMTGPTLGEFQYLPGQDVMIPLALDDGAIVTRRYSIRRFDRQSRQLDIEVVTHGDGPGARWVKRAQAGDFVEIAGPRGKIFLNEAADWHLFAGDDSAVSVSLAMLEALPVQAPALAFLEVVGPEDQQSLAADERAPKKLTWLHRGQETRDGGARLVDAITTASFPPGRVHAYLAGEVSIVAGLKTALLAMGIPAEQLSPKAYWADSGSNGPNGEPEKRA